MNLVWHVIHLPLSSHFSPENSKQSMLHEQFAEAFESFAGNVEDLLSSAEL